MSLLGIVSCIKTITSLGLTTKTNATQVRNWAEEESFTKTTATCLYTTRPGAEKRVGNPKP